MPAVEQEQAGPVRTIALNRPEVLNAFDEPMLAALRAALADAVADPAVRGIVLTGRGRAFSTGEDLRAARALDGAGFRAQIETLQALATELRDAPTPVIAAVAGPAYGGGLELAVNCDARIAATSARFACPETRWGLTITNGASLLLRRLVGEGWARELALLGTVVDAQEARRIGLVTRVVADDRLRAEAVAVATTLAELDPAAVAATKRLLNADPAPWPAVLGAELEEVVRGFAAPAVRERLDAFGRKP
ncbi:MAG: enoyl-CoA hydratase/isomerase family protein [Solirubrobacteraceae bacterium]